MNPAFVVLFLSLLLGLQPATTDLYLPALPAMTEALAAQVSHVQLTLSALLLAFGVSQLVWGPLSDRYGRRPVLIAGLGAYTLASFGSVLAGSIEVLIAWRIVQGAAMGAVVMCGRALVRDLYSPEIGPRVMSKGLSGVGVIACLSAPLGGLITQFLGWRITLLTLALVGSATLWLTVVHFTETLRAPNARATRPGVLLETWMTIVVHPGFQAFALLSTFSYAGLFTFLASSSFVFIDVLGFSRPAYGLVMLASSLAYLMGTVICRRLLVRVGLRTTVAIGGALSLIGGTLIGTLAAMGVASPVSVLLPFLIFMLGHGVHQPCGQSGAVGPFPQAAGAASALNGFMIALLAFAMGIWLGRYMDSSVFALAYGVWFWSAAVAFTAWILVPRASR
ncbi:Bcr/CflA family drug resistance efflux transporter [Parazoarcus communis]|uniref:Bcr/CflA family efflux transporter n=1 Tax=Parazoarcus communis TaxID=41977 RepID=A0A2U8H4S5_9RHOO|nr:multidrug effflux MFS transporter [Parazoarcus communis]AWI81089.1 Bcr/CflA family drug resistance efflux transporter [Parazoarcus communis]